MSRPNPLPAPAGSTGPPAPEVEVVIEVPRGGFVKRDRHGQVVFVSPLPCPYNYGSVPTHLGLEGDLLDAIVLGPLDARHEGLGLGRHPGGRCEALSQVAAQIPHDATDALRLRHVDVEIPPVDALAFQHDGIAQDLAHAVW
jgi:hypothetical protein